MDVEIKDIPESMINMVDIVGIRKFLEITKIYGGASVYIPLYKSIIRPARDRDIIKKYNGFNEKELAKMYNISVYNVKRIIQGKSWINYFWCKHKICCKHKKVCIFLKENTHFLIWGNFTTYSYLEYFWITHLYYLSDLVACLQFSPINKVKLQWESPGLQQ